MLTLCSIPDKRIQILRWSKVLDQTMIISLPVTKYINETKDRIILGYNGFCYIVYPCGTTRLINNSWYNDLNIDCL